MDLWEDLMFLNNIESINVKSSLSLSESLQKEFDAIQSEENIRKKKLLGLTWIYLLMLVLSFTFLTISI